MIRSINANYLDQVSDGLWIATTHDIGYEVKAPTNIKFSKTNISIYHHITEKSQTLYGFPNEEDRQLFVDLLSVDGVGPAMALKILSGYPTEKIRIDLGDGDVEDLAKAKGFGKKTAEKVVKALQPSYAEYATNKPENMPETTLADESRAQEFIITAMTSAYKALIKLGFTGTEAKRRVQYVLDNHRKVVFERSDHMWTDLDGVISNLIKFALAKAN